MVKWNEKRNVLQHEPSRYEKFPLKEVEEPNLFRELFPYSEIPKIDFDHKLVIPEPADDIFITDTTFRDGQQARPPYTPEEIVRLFDMMHRLGGPGGIIRQTEFFLYSDKDRKALDLCRDKGHRYPEITGWIRANAKDLKLVREAGLNETGMLTSVSDYHIFLKLKSDRRKTLDSYLGLVKEALSLGIIPRCHFEDITRADIYGFCVPFAIELMKLSQEADMPVKIRLCDTMGYGVPYPGSALPRSVPKLVRAMIDDAEVPGKWLEWHGHNDFHKVLINASTAWIYGCAGANSSLLGFGERTGNTALEGLIIEWISLKGRDGGADTTMITEIRNYFEHELGTKIPDNYPFVGKNFNVTRAGIHADGLIKNEEIYNIFDTSKILKRPLGVTITDKSGLAGIAHWVNSQLFLTNDKRLDKRHPGIGRIHKKVMAWYEEGRTTGISDEEMDHLSARYLPELFISEFDRVKRKVRHLATELVEELIAGEEFKAMDPGPIEKALRKCADDNPFIQFAYVVDLEGNKITRNITQMAEKAKFEVFEEGVDFSDRDWFVAPLKDGKIFVTDFFTSKLTGNLCITASATIQGNEGEIVGLVGLDFKFEEMARLE